MERPSHHDGYRCWSIRARTRELRRFQHRCRPRYWQTRGCFHASNAGCPSMQQGSFRLRGFLQFAQSQTTSCSRKGTLRVLVSSRSPSLAGCSHFTSLCGLARTRPGRVDVNGRVGICHSWAPGGRGAIAGLHPTSEFFWASLNWHRSSAAKARIASPNR